jgi:hypothetical protein
MVQTQSPIGKFILLTYQEPNFIGDLALREKVENLVDLIKIKTQTRGLNHTSQSIQNELFDIRIELLNFLMEKPDILKLFEKRILEEITNKYYITGVYKKLGQTVADALEIYFKIFSHLSNIVSNEISTNSFKINEIPSLNGLKYLLSLQPSKDVENYITWLEASLDFDYALIVSDLIFSNTIHLKQNQTQQLELFIRKSIVDFGSYSIVTNFWQPEVEDELQLIRNIKIKAATLEIESGRTISIPSEALHQFISS